MNVEMVGDVIQAKRYNMDGNRGGSILMTQSNDGSNDDLAGLEVMKMTADYEVVDKLRASLPCKCKVVARPVAGAGQKMAFKVVSVEPVQRPAQQQAKA
ncbi:hypothetical protein QKW35_06030 [Pontibacterium granulatum]|uniref:hypothetical protein n=1 Tax=Pontibacterium granulatum TaxID=2036029 RepID=UPI00249AE2CA|nr:hypothetical protein [Pontibacterium granulatum]MDI3323927.1 hypothetical protein [Pontibacterium granulatum]